MLEPSAPPVLETPGPGTSAPNIDHVLIGAFLDNVPDRVFFKDLQSRYIAVSRSVCQNFGCNDKSEVLGKTDYDFFVESHARATFADEQKVMRSGEAILSKLEMETWPDGRITWARTNKMALRNEKGAIIGTFGSSQDVTEAKHVEIALEKSQKDLLQASHLAGMAEVATGVLHNVGNVLTSVNVSADVIATEVRQLKSESLTKVCALLKEHANDLAEFLTNDPKGKRIPEFIQSLAEHFNLSRTHLLQESKALQEYIDHIKQIVNMQQAYAKMAGVIEPLDASMLMEDSLRMNTAALVRHEVKHLCDYQQVPLVMAERAKVLQILINLIRNAKYALDEGGKPDKMMTLKIEAAPDNRVRMIVSDNGIGIAPDNLTKIFAHGFTTRASGHGFGLHSSALAAQEMRGSLSAFSDGLGKGATFVLELPTMDPRDAVPSFDEI